MALQKLGITQQETQWLEFWSLNVEVTGGDKHDVNVENDVTVAYAEGSEDPVNPRTE